MWYCCIMTNRHQPEGTRPMRGLGCRWKQKLPCWIMLFKSFQCYVALLNRITIDAAMRTGIVCADVSRGIATALLPVALQLHFPDQRDTGDSFQAFRVHTTRLDHYARHQKRMLRTHFELHSMRPGHMRKLYRQFA